MDYFLHILIILNIYIILSISTSFIVGQLNLLSIGQAAFYGIGAYLTALVLKILGLPLLPGIIIVFVFTGISSILIGYVSLKLNGDYFILATLGIQIIVYSILYNWTEVTNGPLGIPGIPSPEFLGHFRIQATSSFVLLSFAFSIITLIVFYRLINSPFGVALRGIRDNPTFMLSLGINVNKWRLISFVLSSTFAGLGGYLYASYISYIDPTSFNLDESIFILSAVLIGGTGNIKGPITGAIFIIVIPEALRFIGISDSIAANLRMIIYGSLLITLMRWRSQGIMGEYKI